MRSRLDRNHPDLARAYNSLAIVAWERGDTAARSISSVSAVAAWKTGHNDALTAGGLFNLAMILHSAGRDREALPAVRESRALRRQAIRRHPSELVGDSDHLLGEILAALGQADAARAALQQAVRLTMRRLRARAFAHAPRRGLAGAAARPARARPTRCCN